MDTTPANLGPGGAHEHQVRAVYSNLVRAINHSREQDPQLTEGQITEALQRLAAKYEAG